jgi:hypothetical protein
LSQQCLRILPLSYTEECVRANDDEYLCALRQLVAQAMQRVDGVVRFAVALWAVDRRSLNAAGSLAKQLNHAKPIGEGGVRTVRLERLDRSRCEQHAVECEPVAYRLRYGEMTSMRWIETPSEEAYSHLAIVSRALPESPSLP